MKYIAVVVLCLVCTVPFKFQNAQAYDYPMSGIDGQFTVLDPYGSVTLTDEKGAPLVIRTGPHRLRLSQASRQLHIMTWPDQLQTLAIPYGYPGGDLRNFYLPAQTINQPDHIQGITRDIRGPEHEYETYQSCQWVCAYDQICRPNPPHGQICHSQPRYCYGHERVRVIEARIDRVFDMNLINAKTNATDAHFNGIVDSSWDRRSYIISSCY